MPGISQRLHGMQFVSFFGNPNTKCLRVQLLPLFSLIRNGKKNGNRTKLVGLSIGSQIHKHSHTIKVNSIDYLIMAPVKRWVILGNK